MEASLVAKQVAVLAVLIAIGYIGTKNKVINEDTSKGMASILTNIALPSLIISLFNMNYTDDAIKGVILIFVYSIGAHILNALVVKPLYIKYSRGKNVVLRFGTIFANTGFMGLPLIYDLIGQEAAIYGSVFMIPYHIILWTYGEGILSKEKGGSAIKKLIKNPSLIAVLIGIILFASRIQLPYVASKSLSMLSGLTSPLSMLILGEKMAKFKLKEVIGDKDIYYGCFVKLIVIPIVSLIILKLIKAPELLTNIVVLMQSLPAAILLVVLTQKHDGEIEFASKFAVISHVVSVFTIPLISLLL